MMRVCNVHMQLAQQNIRLLQSNYIPPIKKRMKSAQCQYLLFRQKLYSKVRTRLHTVNIACNSYLPGKQTFNTHTPHYTIKGLICQHRLVGINRKRFTSPYKMPSFHQAISFTATPCGLYNSFRISESSLYRTTLILRYIQRYCTVQNKVVYPVQF